MSGTTEKMLEARIALLNKTMGLPPAPYKHGHRPDLGRIGMVPCEGNYHLDAAYGGYTLMEMNSDGSTNKVFNCGYTTKPALFDLIEAFLRGVQAAQYQAKGGKL
jgi:hypothetical protein